MADPDRVQRRERPGPLMVVAGLNWQRQVGPIVPNIADHFPDRPDFERCVRARLEQRHQLVLGRRSFTQPCAAYKALVEKRSYSGPATVSGKNYQANYAPLIGADGKLTGALFVGVPK